MRVVLFLLVGAVSISTTKAQSLLWTTSVPSATGQVRLVEYYVPSDVEALFNKKPYLLLFNADKRIETRFTVREIQKHFSGSTVSSIIGVADGSVHEDAYGMLRGSELEFTIDHYGRYHFRLDGEVVLGIINGKTRQHLCEEWLLARAA